MDSISTSVIKSSVDLFAPLIACLAMLSFTECTFPSRFKVAPVTLLPKKKGLNCFVYANYRLISDLNTISKIIERITMLRITAYVESSLSYNPFQSQSAYLYVIPRKRPLHVYWIMFILMLIANQGGSSLFAVGLLRVSSLMVHIEQLVIEFRQLWSHHHRRSTVNLGLPRTDWFRQCFIFNRRKVFTVLVSWLITRCRVMCTLTSCAKQLIITPRLYASSGKVLPATST